MNAIQTPLKDVWIIESEMFEDLRGRFARLYCRKTMQQFHKDLTVQQINHSLTVNKGSIRGLHFQYPPKAEIKLVRCLKGRVFDVVVDLRRTSTSFLHWHGIELSESDMKMVYIPKGVAHGFQSLEDNSEMFYLHTENYYPGYEGRLRYNDPKLAIDWPLHVSQISDKDARAKLISESFQGIQL